MFCTSNKQVGCASVAILLAVIGRLVFTSKKALGCIPNEDKSGGCTMCLHTFQRLKGNIVCSWLLKTAELLRNWRRCWVITSGFMPGKTTNLGTFRTAVKSVLENRCLYCVYGKQKGVCQSNSDIFCTFFATKNSLCSNFG